MIKASILGASALMMTAVPIAASAAPVANPAQSLSVASSIRSGTPTSKASKLSGERSSVIPFVIGAAVVAGVVYLIVDNEDDDSDSN